LNKNIVVTRFVRNEATGFVTVNVGIAIDNLQLANDIKKLKKEDIQKRLERVRKKKEMLFRN